MPGRLGATYIGEDGNKHTPVMLHRAIFGSLERFTGILVEHHAGNLPLWLAPTQIKVLTITSDADEYAEEVAAELRAAGGTDLMGNAAAGYGGRFPVLIWPDVRSKPDRHRLNLRKSAPGRIHRVRVRYRFA